MNHTTVTCGCGAKVIPRLWYVYGNVFSHTLTQHICPICGVVMYETGGGFRAYVPVVASLAFSMLALGYFSGGHWVTGAMSIVVSSMILLFRFPVFSGRLVRRILFMFRINEKQVSQA